MRQCSTWQVAHALYINYPFPLRCVLVVYMFKNLTPWITSACSVIGWRGGS